MSEQGDKAYSVGYDDAMAGRSAMKLNGDFPGLDDRYLAGYEAGKATFLRATYQPASPSSHPELNVSHPRDDIDD